MVASLLDKHWSPIRASQGLKTHTVILRCKRITDPTHFFSFRGNTEEFLQAEVLLPLVLPARLMKTLR